MSNYLNKTKNISPSVLDRIEEAIRFLHYVPNSASRVMRGQRSHSIGFVVPDAANPFFAEVTRGLEDAALLQGHVIITCNSQGDPLRESKYLKALAEMRVMGVAITPTVLEDTDLDMLLSTGARVVVIDEPGNDRKLSHVSVDNRLGGWLAMTHLLDLGHTDVLFVGAPGGHGQSEQRLDGAQLAARERGYRDAILRRIDVEGFTAKSRADVGERVLQLRTLPTAIFCVNDLVALAIQATLARASVLCPDDISIVGYDDIDHAQLAAVPLTTVRQPMYEIGAAATRLLLTGPGGPQKMQRVSFEPDLVVRASTAAPR